MADNSNNGCVQVKFKTTSYSDQFTNAPSVAEQQWMQSHFARVLWYAPYGDSRLSWLPQGWFYRDSSSLYNYADVSWQHPEWILRDQWGQALSINWGCSNGTCPQYSPDYGNKEFQSWWISEAAKTFQAGYKGIFIDDVNLRIDLTVDGWGSATPIDPRTNQPMTEAAWQKYFADFMVAVRNAFPDKEICHNALWFVANGNVASNPDVKRTVLAANYINLERGFADPGLNGDNGFWSVQNLMRYIDQLHAFGVHAVPQQYTIDGQFSVACYLLINDGADLFSSDDLLPNNWPAIVDVNIGHATSDRYEWNGVIRRDFSGGIVLANMPGPGRTVVLPESYVDQSGAVVSSIYMEGRSGAVLKNYVPAGPIAAGVYTIRNQHSQLMLDVPGFSNVANTQVIQWAQNGGSNQSWRFTPVGTNEYTIQSEATGLFLSAPARIGWSVTQDNARNDDTQIWTLKASGDAFVVLNKNTGWALADPQSSTAWGTGMTIWAAGGYPDQSWEIR